MRYLVVPLLVGVALTACSSGDDRTTATVPPELREAVAEVNELYASGQDRLGTALDAVREVDLIIDHFRDAATVDEAREVWPQVDEVVTRVDIEELREPFFELAHAVDRARSALRAAQEQVDEDWQRDALEAEDVALSVIREYAEEADRLARRLITHWPTYASLTDSTGEFVEQRWFYRDSEEAADAYELAVSSHLDPLRIAQEEIAVALQARDEAAGRVNEAVRAAAEQWERRPGTSPGGGDG